MNLYIKPAADNIPAIITKLTGIDYQGGQMFHHGKPVDSVATREGLTYFCEWLKTIPGNHLLIAHNVMFDARILLESFTREKLPFPSNVAFADSLKLFRTVYPNQTSYKLENLVSDLKGISFTAHDAAEDVDALLSIIDLDAHFDLLDIIPCSCMLKKVTELNNKRLHYGSYLHPCRTNIMTRQQAKLLSRNGIGLSDLKQCYFESGSEGLCALLKDQGVDHDLHCLTQKLAAMFEKHQFNKTQCVKFDKDS